MLSFRSQLLMIMIKMESNHELDKFIHRICCNCNVEKIDILVNNTDQSFQLLMAEYNWCQKCIHMNEKMMKSTNNNTLMVNVIRIFVRFVSDIRSIGLSPICIAV